MTLRTPPTLDHQPARPAERDWIDTTIEWTSGLAAVAMFAYGVALSYAVLYAIAEAAGLPPWARRLWPGGWELFMASAALNALAEQRHLRGQHGWRRVPWYPLALTGLTAGGSILLNWFHPAIPLDPPPGWLRSLVYGLPPLEAVLAWHLFLLRIAHRRHPSPVTGTVPVAVPGPGPEADRRDEPAGTAGVGDPAHQQAADGHGGPLLPRPARTPAGPNRSRPAPPRPTIGTAGVRDAGLLAQARAAAAEHDTTHGRPISRDALRQALRVSNQTAGALLRELRADQADPHRPPQDQDGAVAAQVGQPEPADLGPASERGPAGNGAGGRPGGLAAMVPAVPTRPRTGGRGPAMHDHRCPHQQPGRAGGVGVLVAVTVLALLVAPYAKALRDSVPAGLPAIRLPRLAGPPSPAVAAASPRAGRAVAFALAQQGKPYRWGAEGPGAYDCSGLVWAAWRSAGVTIPRAAAAQLAGLPRVRGRLRPGDLVVYRSDGPTRRHVAMVVGGGRMVEALGRGVPVRVVGLRGGFLGAVRPGGAG